METLDTIQLPEPSSYPPLVKRFQSVFIDQLFIITCMFVLSQVFSNESEDETAALRGILMFSLFFLYEPVCMSFGRTLGNYVAGIRVRRFEKREKRINIFYSYIRYVVKITLGIISFFTVTSDKWKRAIHDKAADSIMIYANRNVDPSQNKAGQLQG